MSIINDIYLVDEISGNFKNVRSAEDLQAIIQSSRDVFDKYITDLKSIPYELERWQNVAKDIGILSESTDFVNDAKDLLLRTALDATENTVLEGKLGLENLLKTKDELLNQDVSQYSIGGIKIDYIYNPNPNYSTTAVTQPIVSSSNNDILAEDAENKNVKLNITCLLRGDDVQSRFEQINTIRENKQIIQVITNNVYDKMLITKLSPTYDNSDGLEFDISLENVFVAQLKRVNRPITASKDLSKENTVVEEIQEPIPTQQEPLPTYTDVLGDGSIIGNVSETDYYPYFNEVEETLQEGL